MFHDNIFIYYLGFVFTTLRWIYVQILLTRAKKFEIRL